MRSPGVSFVAALLAAVALATGGCSGSGDGTRAVSAESRATATATATSTGAVSPNGPSAGAQPVWVTRGLVPVSRVKVVAGVPLVLTRTGAALSVTALRPGTGEVAWTRPASPSGVVPGIAVSFANPEGTAYAAWFEPTAVPGSGYARLVVVDPRGGGRVLARSTEFRFLSYPGACDDDERQLCVEAESDSGAATYRFGPGQQDLTEVTTAVSATRLESIGPRGLVRLYRPGDDRLRIGVVRHGRLVWSRPEAELFGPDHTTNGGWTFQYVESTHTLVGSVGRDLDLGETFDLPSHTMTLSFREADGRVVWKRPGLDTFCDRDFTEADDDPLVACRWTAGTAVAQRPRMPVHDAAYALVRIDPRNGRDLWTRDLGRLPMATYETPDFAVGAGTTVVPTAATPKVVDLRTGGARPARATDLAWRDHDLAFEGEVPHRARHITTFERAGVVDEQLVGGLPAPGVRLPLPASVGARVGGLVLVALEGKVVAFRER